MTRNLRASARFVERECGNRGVSTKKGRLRGAPGSAPGQIRATTGWSARNWFSTLDVYPESTAVWSLRRVANQVLLVFNPKLVNWTYGSTHYNQ